MDVRHYGIYLAYPPTVDLRSEGLGRHLAAFLKGAEQKPDLHFTIVCPSWSEGTLRSLFVSEDVDVRRIDIISPVGRPYALRAYESWVAWIRRRSESRLIPRLVKKVMGAGSAIVDRLERRAVSVHSWRTLVIFFVSAIPLPVPLVMLSPVFIFLYFVRFISRFKRVFELSVGRLRSKFDFASKHLSSAVSRPQELNFVFRLFRHMEEVEAARMLSLIGKLHYVRAWYCPTAFWPAFNKIDAPRLMCVPDVVLTEFPVGFSRVAGDRFLSIFESIGESIRSADRVVTYSDHVKWDTLVNKYNIPEERITVIRHAPNKLDQWLGGAGVTSESDEDAVRRAVQDLFRGALNKGLNRSYLDGFVADGMNYIFYASQFRPSKNVIALLRAYDFLLKRRFYQGKLILTGGPLDMPEIQEFVNEHRLDNDVLFLRGLSLAELAACYRLADLAVNPSLSEGGCPFTFSEALSVGTPVIMARIAVTEEVLTDSYLQSITLFDPYDWRSLVERVEWALKNRGDLLKVQSDYYSSLCRRSWEDVAMEHVELLDAISLR